ncbi:MAG: hypothetical protein Q8R08_04270 [bacterium]|nr:hypothetical protein [bacterium]
MTIREKVLSWVGLAVLVAAAIAYSQYQTKLDLSYNKNSTPIGSQRQTAANGSVDNTVNELIDDVSAEALVAAEEDADADLVDDDSQEINSIGESYAGTEF